MKTDKQSVVIIIGNSSEVWRQELMEMAQQVKSSLTLANQRQQYCHSPRSSRLNKHRCKRMSSSLSRCNYEEDDEKVPSKRLLYRRTSHRSPTPRSKCDEKSEHEQTAHDNYQDSGIWVIYFERKLNFYFSNKQNN